MMALMTNNWALTTKTKLMNVSDSES